MFSKNVLIGLWEVNFIFQNVMKEKRELSYYENAQNVKRKAYQHAQRVVEILLDIIEDDTQSASDRIKAGKEILDRGIGKAKESIDMNVKGTLQTGGGISEGRLAQVMDRIGAHLDGARAVDAPKASGKK